jgi:hypothetical protein
VVVSAMIGNRLASASKVVSPPSFDTITSAAFINFSMTFV